MSTQQTTNAIIGISFLSLLTVSIAYTASAEDRASIHEAEVVSSNFLSWGAPRLPYNQVADIKDDLLDKVLGKLVPDRHGIPGGAFKSPFNSPQNGEFVIISLWENKVEGCFVEAIVQHAPKNTQRANLPDSLVPTLLELGVGGQAIALRPNGKSAISFPRQSYTYETTHEATEKYHRKHIIYGDWYMTRNQFIVDSNTASILSNAPIKEVRARVTLSDGETIAFPIGQGTVGKWQELYRNPICARSTTLSTREQGTGNRI